MTREEAIRILDPKTTGEALAEIEYYHGFSGKTAAIQAVSDACEIAVAGLRCLQELESRFSVLESNTPLTVEELRQLEGEPVWVKIIDSTDFSDPKDAFDDYGLVRKSWVRMWDRERGDVVTVSHHFEEYGKTWLAYRNKPKEDSDVVQDR